MVEWRVKPGDEVHRGDIVAVVDTDKADIDVEIFESGVIEQLLVPVGQRVAVGTPLAVVTRTGRRPPTHARPKPAPAAEPALEPAAPRRRTGEPTESRARGAAALPRAAAAGPPPGRRPGGGHGHGRVGRITRDDVERASRQRPSGDGAGAAAEARPSPGGCAVWLPEAAAPEPAAAGTEPVPSRCGAPSPTSCRGRTPRSPTTTWPPTSTSTPP